MVAIPFYLASIGLVAAGLLGFQTFWIWLVACFVTLTSWIFFGSRALRPGVVVLFVQIGALSPEPQYPCGFPADASAPEGRGH